MTSDVSGTKGEYRHLPPVEIAVIVKTVRKIRGVLQCRKSRGGGKALIPVSSGSGRRAPFLEASVPRPR
jgi:hypothetical protein